RPLRDRRYLMYTILHTRGTAISKLTTGSLNGWGSGRTILLRLYGHSLTADLENAHSGRLRDFSEDVRVAGHRSHR
ncbi:hypothetical protein A262_27407, partial [Pseudomonas syringae pv. actinidiae ICMP 19073]